MFSSTTIASSITMPTASASASSVIMLSVKCAIIIRPNVEMIETGIAIAAMIVERSAAEEQQHDERGEHRAEHEVLEHLRRADVRIWIELSRTTSTE